MEFVKNFGSNQIAKFPNPYTTALGRSRHEGWTGCGLDWIRTIANFVEFGLDPDCKLLQNLGSGQDLD